MASSIEVGTLGMIAAAPGVRHNADGTTAISGEVVIVIAQDKLGTEGQVANVLVRGVPPAALQVRPDVHVVAGRPPRPGTDEVMIGRNLRGKYTGMDLEQSFDLKKNRPVKVVGVFEAGGSSFESEVWADVDTARSSFGRDGLVSSVTVRLDSASKFDAFKATMESDKRLGLEALTESGYYEKQSKQTSMFIMITGIIIVVFFSFGAMIGAVITMQAAVSQRQREIGTLRALGFSRFSILISFLPNRPYSRSRAACSASSAPSCMSFVKLSMMNFATWQEVTFSFDPNPGVLLISPLLRRGDGRRRRLLPRPARRPRLPHRSHAQLTPARLHPRQSPEDPGSPHAPARPRLKSVPMALAAPPPPSRSLRARKPLTESITTETVLELVPGAAPREAEQANLAALRATSPCADPGAAERLAGRIPPVWKGRVTVRFVIGKDGRVDGNVTVVYPIMFEPG